MKFINHFCKSLSFSIVIMFFLIVSILGCGTERFENSKKLLEKMTPKIPSLSPEDVVDKIATSIPFMQEDPLIDVPRGSVIINTKPHGGMIFFNGINRGRALKGKPIIKKF